MKIEYCIGKLNNKICAVLYKDGEFKGFKTFSEEKYFNKFHEGLLKRSEEENVDLSVYTKDYPKTNNLVRLTNLEEGLIS